MKKLKLGLEELAVESFDTSPAEKERGTVVGQNHCTCQTDCTCPGCPTCEGCQTCGNEDTCAATCAYSCDDYSCDPTCVAYHTCYNCL